MFRRRIPLLFASLALACVSQAVATGQELCCDWSRPACGKVCKLVCEPRKLTAVCYGCECKEICIPSQSRRGCKHCATCYSECSDDPCSQGAPPKCEICWRDWFACGCAKPRSVTILTKYQVEKKICWYHWEVVDAACCDCVGKNGEAASGGSAGVAPAAGPHFIYKPAPVDAELGEVLPVSEEEWVQLAAVLTPDPHETAAQVADNLQPAVSAASEGEVVPLEDDAERRSLAERFGRLFK